MKFWPCFLLGLMLHLILDLLPPSIAHAQPILAVDFEVSAIEANPYFRPYLAVWVETAEREPVATLALWYMLPSDGPQEDGKKWLKDLRQWWRKMGRDKLSEMDAVTGATRKPGSYSLCWDAASLDKSRSYVLHLEAAREEGGRSYRRIPFQLTDTQTHTLAATKELGAVQLKLGEAL